MMIDQYEKNVQKAIDNEQEEEDTAYLQLESMDQLMNLLPKRIRKEDRPFQQDKLDLLNIAQQESMIDANLRNMKPFKMSELLFPGEEKLVYMNSPDRVLDKVIMLPQGVNKSNLIKMKFDANIPYEIQKEYNINYKSEDRLLNNKNDGEEQKSQTYSQMHLLKIKPRQDSDYLYQLVSKERLRKFDIKSSNEYFLYTDIPPTSEDIEKRAMILAKLYCKYNLKGEQEKAKKREEEKLRIKHHEQVQMTIINKVLSNQQVTKEDLELAQSQIKQAPQEVAQQIRDIKEQRKKARLLSNQPIMTEEQEVFEQEEIKEQQSQQQSQQQQQQQQQVKSQQVINGKNDSQKQNLMSINTNNIGASQVQYSLEYEKEIAKHIEKISNFYERKMQKYYQQGNSKKLLLCKEEYDTRMRDFQSVSNPEVLLRNLLYIRYQKQIL